MWKNKEHNYTITQENLINKKPGEDLTELSSR